MIKNVFVASSFLAFVIACGSPAPPREPVAPASVATAEWRDAFEVDTATLATTGRNPFFILEPGYRIVLEDAESSPVENTPKARVIITVLGDTELVDGVVTRVVEEREFKLGKLVEVSRNFFAISPATKDVYYFGEDVDWYRDGKVTGHGGAWRSGVNGARFGLIMSGEPKVGEKYYQEIAPKVAMDRAENVSLTETLETPAGKFENCLKVEETTPLEPDDVSVKIYARDVGMIADDSIRLVEHGMSEN